MAAKLLYDIDSLDFSRAAFTLEDIRATNPQRFEFEQLDAVLVYNPTERVIVGLRELRHHEFWARGHLPGRPIFPGVLMLEAAAQLSAFYCGRLFQAAKPTYGFGSADGVRFRRVCVPGDRLILIGRAETVTLKRSLFVTQGVVNGQIAFEATILGISLPAPGPPAPESSETVP